MKSSSGHLAWPIVESFQTAFYRRQPERSAKAHGPFGFDPSRKSPCVVRLSVGAPGSALSRNVRFSRISSLPERSLFGAFPTPEGWPLCALKQIFEIRRVSA